MGGDLLIPPLRFLFQIISDVGRVRGLDELDFKLERGLTSPALQSVFMLWVLVVLADRVDGADSVDLLVRVVAALADPAARPT